jgi:hypothetical protein
VLHTVLPLAQFALLNKVCCAGGQFEMLDAVSHVRRSLRISLSFAALATFAELEPVCCVH